MKQKIKLTESQLNKVVKESIKRILKESTDIDTLQKDLKDKFYDGLIEIFTEEAEKMDYPFVNYDYIDDYTYYVAESIANDCIKLINSNNWNDPKNNFEPFGFVMNDKYGIETKEQLLERDDASDIIIDWFYSCFGTYNLKYNFSNAYSDFMDELENEDENED